MSIKKKLLVLLSAIAMIMSVITVVMAAAEGAAPKLSAEKSGDNQVVVILSATEELTSLNDLQYTVEYNTDAFSYGENDIECLSGCSVLANLDSNLISISETVPGSTIPVSAGGMLSKITFTTQEGYDPTQLYTFKFKLTEAYDQQLEEYSWGKDTFTATLQEQIIPEEEHVTFIDTAGTSTKLYDSVIRSCTPTANDNYMLSDVLAAAGADTSNLAKCRYKLASNDGFTVYLDADEYANLALFYNNGWRSTLEDPTGYEGGWYKVKGLGTITAQNHQLAGCECTNRINTSRDEAELCDYNIHDWGEGEVTTEPDCENPGIRTFTCSHDSSHTRTEEIPALGHDWDDGVETTEPTCENAGVRTFTCKNNPEHTRTEAIDPAGHTWDTEKTEDTPATCETEGEKSIHCSICGAIDPDTIETIPALGHDWDDGVETTEPTCETAGVRTFTCKNNSDHTYTETIEPLGHDWDDGVVTTEASCETPGEKTFTCKNDEEHKKKEEIPALGHTPSEAVKENVVEATTEQEGSYDEVVYCSVCHKELSRTKRTIDKITYKCVEGEGQTWSKDDKEDLQFRFKRTADDESTFDHFKGIKVDGKEVDASNYTAEKGSVIINLKSGFVKTLSAGEHTLTALFDDSDPVDVKFIVAEEQKDSNTSTANKTSTGSSSGSSGTGVSSGNASDVKTGDNYSIMIYLLLMCFSAMIIAVTFRKMRRSDIHNK